MIQKISIYNSQKTKYEINPNVFLHIIVKKHTQFYLSFFLKNITTFLIKKNFMVQNLVFCWLYLYSLYLNSLKSNKIKIKAKNFMIFCKFYIYSNVSINCIDCS